MQLPTLKGGGGGRLRELEMKLSRKESLLYLVCFFLCVSHVSVRHLITRNAYIGDEELKAVLWLRVWCIHDHDSGINGAYIIRVESCDNGGRE